MKNYDVTINLTGGMRVRAESEYDAAKCVDAMDTKQMMQITDFTYFEVTDVQEEEPIETYYMLRAADDKLYFIRTYDRISDRKDLIAVASRQYSDVPVESWNEAKYMELTEGEYQKTLYFELSNRFEQEQRDFRLELESQKPEDIIENAAKILFYNDMVWNFRCNSEYVDFEITSLERLFQKDKPLAYLFDNGYGKLDFSDMNLQQKRLFNILAM